MRPTHSIHIVLAALLFVFPVVWGGPVAIAQPIYGPVLTVERDHFQVNGQPKFLFLVSMFDAIREAQVDPARLDGDLVYIKDTLHADGIRVMANWWEYSGDVFNPTLNTTPRSDTLFNPSTPAAPLRPATLAAVKVLLQKASQKGLIVDLTFTRETLPSPYMTAAAYQAAIVATARELREYGNLLFDVQNEFNLGAPIFSGPRLTVENVQNIVVAVNAPDADPWRIVTASADGTFTAAGTGSMAVDRGLWVVDYHENGGGSEWYADSTAVAVATQIRSALGANPLPIYLGEPTAFGSRTNDDQTATHHRLAAAAAKQAGVAAWTFHQRAGFNLANESFRTRLTTSTVAATEATAVRTAIDAATWGLNPADETDFYHLDALGSVRAVSDQDRVLKARHDYFPFGDGSNTGVPGGIDARRFTGKERDAETGYDYFVARYYASRMGRFTTVDPGHVNGNTFDPQSWNPYAYARNNPLKYTDPTGTEYEICGLDAGGRTRSCGRVSDQYFANLYRSPGAGLRLWGGAIWQGEQRVGYYAQLSVDPTFADFARLTGELSSRWLREQTTDMAISTAIAATGGLAAGAFGGGLAATTTLGLEAPSMTGIANATASGARMANLSVDLTARQFQANLIESGYTVVRQGVGTNGPFTVLSRGEKTYTIYTASSTGGVSAQVRVAGQTVSKIRLSGF